MADDQPSARGTGPHPGIETSVGLPGERKLYVRHMRPEPYHDELHTFRRETERRRHCGNEGWICAVAESHCRHDMMNGLVLGNLMVQFLVCPIVSEFDGVGETGGHWDIFHILLNIWTLRNNMHA